MAQNDDRPPFGKSWNGMYTLVIVALVAEIALFSIVGWIYR
jgi:hypothetical protein